MEQDASNFVTFGFIIVAILGAIGGFMIAKAKIDDMAKIIETYDLEREAIALKMKHTRQVLAELAEEFELLQIEANRKD